MDLEGRAHKHAGARQQKSKAPSQHRRMEPPTCTPPQHTLIESHKEGSR